MTKTDELRKKLIDLYEKYLDNKDITEIAKKTFSKNRGANRFVSLEMEKSLGILEDIGWKLFPDNILKDKARERLFALKEEARNPPKDWTKKVY